jgi:hypothetical protein
MVKIIVLIFLQLLLFSCKQPYSDNEYSNNKQNIVGVKHGIDIADSLDYQTRLNEFSALLDTSFILETHSYFVIASNLSRKETNRIISDIIEPAVVCFYNDFFSHKPDDITSILLFKNDNTYRYWAEKLYGDNDLSRFGYYKPDKKVMLMNISTGTGTLVHELTHALVRYDFPDIPAWFNEGLGSLYERCSLSNGIILGYVNWRLPELQDAIRDKSYTSLDKLVKLTDDEFYGERSSFNYAQARYFCMFLQEKNLLKTFYKTYRDNFKEDNTGKKFIISVLGQDINKTEAEYVKWVNSLREH